MSASTKKYLVIYLGVGLLVDYLLFTKNAPTGVKYSPGFKTIALWPLDLAKSNLI